MHLKVLFSSLLTFSCMCQRHSVIFGFVFSSLLFQVYDNSVIDSLLVELKEEEIEKTFLELKDYLKEAALALKKIAPKNKQNLKEIFNCLELELNSAARARKVRRVTKDAGKIIGFFSAIKGMYR